MKQARWRALAPGAGRRLPPMKAGIENVPSSMGGPRYSRTMTVSVVVTKSSSAAPPFIQRVPAPWKAST